ncbi:hypothetical protein TESG_03193 [Trichophyton tonsurans CBS 112818]|uniref:Ubiquitin-like domain-containing protein n=2 Tax=Trichophyton TaxID=5550 RepID=F2RWM5_TRIT1|nr:hypothetical protein TESG_03193 [Trichophyton tonsurans CBS 112818]
MTSNTSMSGLGQGSDPADSHDQPIVLHILSPSFDSQRRLTFNNLPLSTTILDVKSKIMEELPSRPLPENQRLIYRGRCLSDNSQILGRIFGPSDPLEYSMHLVLPPPAHPTAPPPSEASAAAVRELYRNAQAARERVLSEQYSQQGNDLTSANAATTPQDGVSEGTDDSETSTIYPHPDSGLIRQEDFPPLSMRQLMSYQYPQQHDPPSNGALGDRLHVPGTANGQPSGGASNSNRVNNIAYQVMHIATEIISMEARLPRGPIPREEEISMVRDQLLRLFDDPNHNIQVLRGWLTRLSIMSSRSEQLRQYYARNPHMHSGQTTAFASPSTVFNRRHNAYLLASPTRYEAVLIPAAHGRVASANLTGVMSSPSHPTFQPSFQPTAQQNALAMAYNNLPQAATATQRPPNIPGMVVRRRRLIIRGSTLVRAIRATWLFVRLYFFCYILSDPGTWLRLFLVVLSIAWACLSEVEIPRHIRRAIFIPLEDHIHDLLPADPGPAQPHRARQNAGPNYVTDLLQRHRTLARGVVLFFSSFIPGVSERQIVDLQGINALRENERRAEQENREQAAQQQNTDAGAPAEPNATGEQGNGGEVEAIQI